tara:strand:+ start:93 stop:332 length:240 start_codon:yes stop_codon:yes gene_type:complete
MKTLYNPIVFIVVNHAVSVLNHICLRLIPATSIVLDPIQYIGNTILIIGFGDVNVKIQLPQIVNATDTNSNQNAVLSDL